MSTDAAVRTGPARVAWRSVLLVATVAAAVHLAVATRYGWHRDEFYYVVAGRHPDWGYVDQPPLTPLVARLAADLPDQLLALRVLAIGCQVGCVALTAVLTAQLGGRTRAQALAAAAVAACPLFVGSALLFGTTVVDQVVWCATFVLVVRAVRRTTVGAWLAAGLVAGVGLENKDTVLVLLAGVAVGLALCRRDVLRGPGPWVAGLLAAALAAPNVVWNATHGWPQQRMAALLSAQQGGTLGALAQLPVLLLLFAGPPLIALWVLGVRRLASAAAQEHRWLVGAVIVVVVAFVATGGKFYYAGPVLAPLFAAGAVSVEASDGRRGRVGWPVAVAVSGVLAVLVWLPTLPVTTANDLRAVSPFVPETYGWPQFVDQVRDAEARMPPGTPILAANYGEAGALQLLGPAAGLHATVVSGQNSYADRGPPTGTPDEVLCVGTWAPGELGAYWADVREIAPITYSRHVDGEETDLHAAIYDCRAPRGTWAQLWPRLSHLG